MTKTWLDSYDLRNYDRLINTASASRSNARTDEVEALHNEAVQLLRAVRGNIYTHEAGRVLLEQIVKDIRALYKRPVTEVKQVTFEPMEVLPFTPPPRHVSEFEDGISLQERRKRELAEKWGPLQKKIAAKQAQQAKDFRVPRHLVSYKRVDNR